MAFLHLSLLNQGEDLFYQEKDSKKEEDLVHLNLEVLENYLVYLELVVFLSLCFHEEEEEKEKEKEMIRRVGFEVFLLELEEVVFVLVVYHLAKDLILMEEVLDLEVEEFGKD